MSNVYHFRRPGSTTVIDEAYMESFSNDELAYMAWELANSTHEYFLDEDSKDFSFSETAFDSFQAVLALRVLTRRLTGIEPKDIQAELHKRFLAAALKEISNELSVSVICRSWGKRHELDA